MALRDTATGETCGTRQLADVFQQWAEQRGIRFADPELGCDEPTGIAIDIGL